MGDRLRAAAAVNCLVQPAFGWRAVFFVGILPAFLTLWVRRNVREPAIWQRARRGRAARSRRWRRLFARDLAPLTIALTLMNACTLFGWWGFNLWLPSYLQEPASRGGVGLQMLSSSAMIVVMQVGMWFGYITFGFVSDRIGRKRTYIVYLLAAALLLFVYVSVRAPLGAARARAVRRVLRDRLLQRLRRGDGRDLSRPRSAATAQGFTYNVGRIVSAAAPFTVGTLAQTHGFGAGAVDLVAGVSRSPR